MARVVTARWDGAMATTVTIDGTVLRIGEDLRTEDGGVAPMPTEILLASVTSCLALAIGWAAAKRGITVDDVSVDARAEYDGPRISAIDVAVRSDSSREVVDSLLPSAKRVCYVMNTLQQPPDVTIRLAD